jgi:hypothetical protein
MAPSHASSLASGPIGAYGLRLEGVEEARSFLVAADPGWPSFELTQRAEDPGEAGALDVVSDVKAELQLRSGGRIIIDRSEGVISYAVPRRLRVDELVHPFLAPAAAVIAYWLGRQSFHAGAFVTDGGVLGLLADREGGKSSTLGWLARQGRPVVCDDMLILEGRNALAGPRSVDLRPEAAGALRAGEPLGTVGMRERWRLGLGPVEPALPLRGWVFLSWGDELRLESVPASERFARLFAHRGVRLPPRDPDAVFDLATLPGWELTRPRGWDSLAEGAQLLLDAAAR